MRDETQSVSKVCTDLLEIVGLIVSHIQFSFQDLFSKTVNKREFITQAYEVVWRSISTVIITTVSIGMVSSLQLTKHFATFGAISEIGGTNALALVRELSPVITAVVIAGRVGSAWAAEIGTMQITEQINALKVMRISPKWFLISPRMLACMMSMPILNIIAIISSLAGAYIIAEIITQVGVITFIHSVKRYISVYDFMASSAKSVVFGAVIASIACSCGLKANGGAAGVGKFTTLAVVNCLIFLFALNYVLSFIFYTVLK